MTQICQVCEICGERKRLTKHHIFRRAVWGRTRKNNEVSYICRDCHDILESEITRKENQILRQYPEIYAGTLNEFIVGGKELVNSKRRKR